MTGQMELSFSDQVPGDLGVIHACPGSQAWREAELVMNARDSRFPVRNVPLGNSKIQETIQIRCIEDSIVLWGAQWWNRKTRSGGGFAPFRKWGPGHAATTEQEAIAAAQRYVLDRGGEA